MVGQAAIFDELLGSFNEARLIWLLCLSWQILALGYWLQEEGWVSSRNKAAQRH